MLKEAVPPTVCPERRATESDRETPRWEIRTTEEEIRAESHLPRPTYHVRLQVSHVVSDVLGSHVQLVSRLWEGGKVQVQDSWPGGNHTAAHHYHRSGWRGTELVSSV